MLKKIVDFLISSFKSTPISTSVVVEKTLEIEKQKSVIEETPEKKKRSRKKPKEETSTNID